MKRTIVLGLYLFLAFGAVLFFTACRGEGPREGEWGPRRPIQIIVPWGAGGSTDLVTRIVIPELERELRARIIVSNQPGASGATGTQAALDAARDGYTWTAGSVVDLGLYQVNGLLDTNIREDWHIFLTSADVGIIGVNANSPYQTFADLLMAFMANPGQVRVATAGLTSSGTANIEMIRSHTGIDYVNVPYGGGAPAVTAVVAGEVMVTSQLISEQADMIRGGLLRPLASLTNEDLYLSGFGIIPSIRRYIPEFQAASNWFGIFIPRGVPEEVVATITRVWEERVANSDDVRQFIENRGMVFSPTSGEVAQQRAFEFYQKVGWVLYDNGLAPVRPDAVGIPRP
ncbi:MAG: tripartite tricarboxylate transporter substrate binding protein [Treponema sp.]|nr:tripartite tricarboxylate transporter substrate binding protein [Treponema sp.]